ncbi:hypothetical protein [Vibrio spartinae]|uniref:Uncharacterized protein n=1 Tax=Vibrio spartinae TaxID=1918945 RepID=A0ABX6QX56_9VIBR|nr:hypothetical protein [Vibrio spartinae]QMV13601.1 hypothetical protein Vspart_00839 [Vibrio spartinae]
MDINRKKNNSLLNRKTWIKSWQRLFAKSCCLFLIGFSYSSIGNNAHAFGLGDVVKVGGDLVDSAVKKQDEKEKQEQEQKRKILQDARGYADPIMKQYKHVSSYHGLKVSHDTQTLYSDLKYVYSGDNAEKIRQSAKKLDDNLSTYQSKINKIEQQKKAQKEKERQQRIAAEKKRQEEMRKQAAADKKAAEKAAAEQAAAEKAAAAKQAAAEKAAAAKQAEQEEKERQHLITELQKRRLFDSKLSKYAEQYSSSQLQLVVASYNGQITYNEAKNELAKGGTRGQRKNELCGLQGKHYDWIGKVTTLTTNSEGKGVLAVEFAEDMHLTTANNAFSDIGANSLLDPSSDIFQSALTLSRGDIIRFDGYLFSSRNDCVRELSATLRGSMTEPDYLFKFIHIEKLN